MLYCIIFRENMQKNNPQLFSCGKVALGFTWNSLLLFQEIQEFLKIITERSTPFLLQECFAQICLQFWREVELALQGCAPELSPGFLRQIGSMADDFSCPVQVVVGLQLRLRTGRSFFLNGRSTAESNLNMICRLDSEDIAFCFCGSLQTCYHFTTNSHFITQSFR